MRDGTPLALGALGLLTAGALLRRRGSRATEFPFLFRRHKVGTRICWNLPPEVVEATGRRPGTPPEGESVLVYVGLPGAGQIKRALGVLPIIEADPSWRTGFVILDGVRIFGETKGFASKDAAGETKWVYAFEIPETTRRPEWFLRRISDTIYGEGDNSDG